MLVKYTVSEFLSAKGSFSSIDNLLLLYQSLLKWEEVLYSKVNYSPAAIIRNEKIWNIILLLAFLRKLSSNLDLEYPAVSEENCLKNLLPLPRSLISWEFRPF